MQLQREEGKLKLTTKSSQSHIWIDRPSKLSQTRHVRIIEGDPFRIRGIPGYREKEKSECSLYMYMYVVLYLCVCVCDGRMVGLGF